MATIGVITFPGTCDDVDARIAAGKVANVRSLWHSCDDLTDIDAVVVPGGFSYGDYLRAGAIARFSPIMKAVERFAAAGGPVLGICNGFQILCEAGLLPGALLPNVKLRFVCRQLELEVTAARSRFTATCAVGQRLSIPAKHMSGRFVGDIPDSQVALRYAPGHNVNGSERDIAAITNRAGNVLGLMPHPEHAVEALVGGSEDGLRLFEGLIADV